MPDPLVVLDEARVRVEPGGQAAVRVRVTNTDRIVNGFRVDVVGHRPAEWAEVGPAEIRMLPHEDETVVITFSPPAGTTARSGTYPFGVRVVSLDDDNNSAVVEGDLEVGQVAGLQAKLTPVNSSGRWRGKHTIWITNTGNDSARLRLTGSNVDDALGFLIRPEVVEVGLDEPALARVRVRTRHPVLRGSGPIRIPFSVAAEPEDKDDDSIKPIGTHSTLERPVVDGAFHQRPILARFVLPLLLFALLAAAAGVIYMLNRTPPRLAELNDPSVPAVRGLTATAVDAGTIRLNWYKVAGVEGYYIVQSTKDGTAEGPHEAGSLDSAKTISSLPPDRTTCFTIAALRQGKAGPATARKCATTPAVISGSPQPTGSSSGSPAGGPPVTVPPSKESSPSDPTPDSPSPDTSPTPESPGTGPSTTGPLVGKYVAIGGTYNKDATPEAQVNQWVSEINGQGLKSVRVYSWEDLVLDPALNVPNSWIIAAGPYDTEQEAMQEACPQMSDVLLSQCYARSVKAAAE